MKIGYLMQEGVDIRRPPFNGPATHVTEVVRALVQRGHHVRVIVRVDGRIWRSDNLMDFETITARWLDRGALRLLERGVRRLQSELRLPYAAMFESFRFAQACVQELRGYDLLYERLGWVGYGGGLAARRLAIPLIIEYNGDDLLDMEAKGIAPRGLQRRLSIALMRQAIGRVAHVVSTGSGWRRHFVERWDYDPDRVTAVENGTTLAHLLQRKQLRSFSPDEDRTDRVTLVYLGGFYPWHGVPVLLEAFAKALARGARARLLMIGSGDGLTEARRLASGLNLNGEVTFAGHLQLEEYGPLLARADVGLSPYCNWPEFSGLKVLDYKAAGLATIASGNNGDPPTLREGVTGLIVPPGDVEALSRAIVRLSTDSTARRQMGRAARLQAEAMHGWDQTAKQLEQVFRRVLRGSTE